MLTIITPLLPSLAYNVFCGPILRVSSLDIHSGLIFTPGVMTIQSTWSNSNPPLILLAGTLLHRNHCNKTHDKLLVSTSHLLCLLTELKRLPAEDIFFNQEQISRRDHQHRPRVAQKPFASHEWYLCRAVRGHWWCGPRWGYGTHPTGWGMVFPISAELAVFKRWGGWSRR